MDTLMLLFAVACAIRAGLAFASDRHDAILTGATLVGCALLLTTSAIVT